jgi:hypothetical protein
MERNEEERIIPRKNNNSNGTIEAIVICVKNIAANTSPIEKLIDRLNEPPIHFPQNTLGLPKGLDKVTSKNGIEDIKLKLPNIRLNNGIISSSRFRMLTIARLPSDESR